MNAVWHRLPPHHQTPISSSLNQNDFRTRKLQGFAGFSLPQTSHRIPSNTIISDGTSDGIGLFWIPHTNNPGESAILQDIRRGRRHRPSVRRAVPEQWYGGGTPRMPRPGRRGTATRSSAGWSVTHSLGRRQTDCGDHRPGAADHAAPDRGTRRPGGRPPCHAELSLNLLVCRGHRSGGTRLDRRPTRRAAAGQGRALRGTHRSSETEQLLRAMDGYEEPLMTQCALRLAPLVFVRPGELRQAEWRSSIWTRRSSATPLPRARHAPYRSAVPPSHGDTQ